MAAEEKHVSDSILLSAMWKALNCPPDDDVDANKVIAQYAEFRDAQEIHDLTDAFLAEFGEDGEKIAVRPSQAIAFNGGGHTDQHNEHYFPGMHYSIPLVSYTMRRALGDDHDEAYDKYIEGVDRIARKTGTDVDRYPPIERIEKLAAPYLKKLCPISHESRAQTDQHAENDSDLQEIVPI